MRRAPWSIAAGGGRRPQVISTFSHVADCDTTIIGCALARRERDYGYPHVMVASGGFRRFQTSYGRDGFPLWILAAGNSRVLPKICSPGTAFGAEIRTVPDGDRVVDMQVMPMFAWFL